MAGPECPAHGIVPGCPRSYNFLRSSAFLANQVYLYGRSRVHLNVPASGRAKSSYLAFVSHLFPATFYSLLQRHVPYNTEHLSARRIMQEAASVVAAQAEDLAGKGDSERRFKRKVWRLLTHMRGDQKWYSLRFGAWLCTHFFQWLFNGEIYVDPKACEALRNLADASTFMCAVALAALFLASRRYESCPACFDRSKHAGCTEVVSSLEGEDIDFCIWCAVF